MTFALADFQAAFPELSDPSKYTPAQIAFWETQAYLQLSPDRFGDALDLAAMLFTAHNVVMGYQNAAAVAAGGVPGQSSGPVTSRSVGGVSKGMDAGAVTFSGAGPYNETSYGRRLLELMKRYSLGGVFVAGPSSNAAAALPIYPYEYGVFGKSGWGW